MSSTTPFGQRTTELLGTLTLEEKAAITAGSGFFTMTGVKRLGIPDWGTTDGPNGARGSSMLGSGESKATCLPCGSALGATWNPALVEELGVMLGNETRTKAFRVLLAPTVNLHRSPLAGRNFECFSEDPLLTGLLAAAYIRGVQSQGVATTVKHFVGNEAETDRWTSNSLIDERALRELYLVPFEYAVTLGRTLGIMTSYNRVNGAYCTEQRWLLTDLLRGEWGFDGFVTTDWLAGADTVRSADAGLDIEMPAGNRAYGSVLAAAVRDGRVSETALDTLAGRMINVFARLNAWNDEPARELSIDRAEHRALARRASADAMVLLRNEPVGVGPVLPLDLSTIRSIAVIGPNASRAQIMGGGSANLRPFHRTSPLDALRARLGDHVDISYSTGCTIDKSTPVLTGLELMSPEGEPGFTIEVFDNVTWSGVVVGVTNRDTGRLFLNDAPIAGVKLESYSARAHATFTPHESGEYALEMMQVSPTRVLIDGEVVIDGITTKPPSGTAFFGFGSVPMRHNITMTRGRAYHLTVEILGETVIFLAGGDLRLQRPVDANAMAAAVTATAAADVAIVVVGTNDDWETEGEDRTTLMLPGEQDALVAAVVAANPRTVVVVNTGSPVTMPWANDVPAIVQSWFGGQEMADALVDVLMGHTDPGGRLPTTFPQRIEHTPSFGNFPGDNGAVAYAESIYMGYRWYDSRHLPVLFPFGHGLSYTSFEIGSPVLDTVSAPVGDTITVRVPVTNVGHRDGAHVVQCYVRPHQSRIARPDQELKAFAKVALAPGETTTVTLTLDSRAFAYWDPAQPEWPELQAATKATLPQLQYQRRRTEPGWTVDPGRYDIAVGHSSANIAGIANVEFTAGSGA